MKILKHAVVMIKYVALIGTVFYFINEEFELGFKYELIDPMLVGSFFSYFIYNNIFKDKLH